MADDGSAQSTSDWPLPRFHFEVKWDTQVMSFQEVSGLDIQSDEIRTPIPLQTGGSWLSPVLSR